MREAVRPSLDEVECATGPAPVPIAGPAADVEFVADQPPKPGRQGARAMLFLLLFSRTLEILPQISDW